MKRFAFNFGLQVSAAIIPSLAFLFSVPILSARVDIPTFAAFSVMLSIIGFLAALDGGIGRAATYFVGIAVAQNNRLSLSSTVQASLIIGLAFSLFVMGCASLALNWLSGPALVSAKSALQILLVFMPAIVCGAVMKGVLEGLQRFPLSSGLQLLQGLIIGLAPVFTINSIDDLAKFALVVGLVRLFLLGLQIYFSQINLALKGIGAYNSFKNILNYSKWLFVSNLVGLIIVFSDRLLIASAFGYEAVSIYILPMEIISRSMIIVAAFASVLFPRLIYHVTIGNNEMLFLIEKLSNTILSLTLAAGFFLLPFIDLLMALWMGSELGGQTRWIVMVGIVGVVLASSSTLSMMGINSLGHTRQIAFLHVLELILLAVLLYLANKHKSLLIVQVAWISRLIIDAIGMQMILNLSVSRRCVSSKNIFTTIIDLMIHKAFRTLMLFMSVGLLLLMAHLSPYIDRITLILMTIPLAIGLLVVGYHNAIQARMWLADSSSRVII